MTNRFVVSAIVVALLCLSFDVGAAGFFPLGDLAGGTVNSRALGVSADGSTVVGRSNSASGDEVFFWTSGGGMLGLGHVPGRSAPSFGNFASGDGNVVVGQSGPSGASEAFMSTGGGALVGLGHLAGGGLNSGANAVSADGSVIVGGSDSTLGPQAFRWTSGTMTGLGDLTGGSFDSVATGVSGDGATVVGGSVSADGPEAYIWTSGTNMVGLGDLAGGFFYSRANAISGDGATVVGTSSSTLALFEAFRWTSGGGMQPLGVLPGSMQSDAYAVSGDGAAVVGTSASSPDQAFIWTNTGGIQTVRALAQSVGVRVPAGWSLEHAYGISADGSVIVGDGKNPDGDTEGWMLSLPDTDSDGTPDYLELFVPVQFIPAARVGNSYSHQVQVLGGQPPYTCIMTAGFLPNALSLGTNCVISGNVIAGGLTASFTVEAMDANGDTASRNMKLKSKIPNCYSCHQSAEF